MIFSSVKVCSRGRCTYVCLQEVRIVMNILSKQTCKRSHRAGRLILQYQRLCISWKRLFYFYLRPNRSTNHNWGVIVVVSEKGMKYCWKQPTPGGYFITVSSHARKSQIIANAPKCVLIRLILTTTVDTMYCWSVSVLCKHVPEKKPKHH